MSETNSAGEHSAPQMSVPNSMERYGDLVHIGEEVSASTIIEGYRNGLFPMSLGDFGFDDPAGWFCPRQRAVFALPVEPYANLSLPLTRSWKKSLKRFSVRLNSAFEEVVDLCAHSRDEGNWIDRKMALAYRELFFRGYAHSIEVFEVDKPDRLVGGLFGIAVGGLFSGESMFHLVTDASKVAFAYLVSLLANSDFTMIDGQWPTDHLMSLGMEIKTRQDYLSMLSEAVLKTPSSLRDYPTQLPPIDISVLNRRTTAPLGLGRDS